MPVDDVDVPGAIGTDAFGLDEAREYAGDRVLPIAIGVDRSVFVRDVQKVARAQAACHPGGAVVARPGGAGHISGRRERVC